MPPMYLLRRFQKKILLESPMVAARAVATEGPVAVTVNGKVQVEAM